jgi:type I restriction enzyme, S subunit
MKYGAYEKTKTSSVEWLGIVPEHWGIMAIKRITCVSRGASPRPIEDPKYFDEDGEYAWVRIADVTSNDCYLRITTQRLSELGKSLSVGLEPGALFLSIAGSVGKPMITAIKACIHDGFVYFPDLPSGNKYLYYVFESAQPFLGLGKFGTQLNLNTDTVGSVKIALPPLSEQHQIANFLDWKTGQIDALIAKKRLLLDKLKEKRLAVITQAVTRGLNPDAPMRDSGIAWLGEVPAHWEVAHLRWFLSTGSGDFLQTEDLEQIANFEHSVPVIGGNGLMGFTSDSNTSPNCLIVGRVGAQCGNVHMVRELCWVTDNALRVTNIDSRFDPEFLFWLLKALNLNADANKNAQPLITGETIKVRKVGIPLLAEQKKIVTYLRQASEKFELMTEKTEAAITHLTEYRTALITAATTGKIDVRGITTPNFAQ